MIYGFRGQIGRLLDTTDHVCHQPVAIERRKVGVKCHQAAIAQDGDPIAKRENLLQLVTDEEDGGAIIAEAAQHAEEPLALMGSDGGGWLVEEQDAALQRERLGDLDELHLGDAELVDWSPGVGGDVERLQPVSRLRHHLGGVDQAGAEVGGRSSVMFSATLKRGIRLRS